MEQKVLEILIDLKIPGNILDTIKEVVNEGRLELIPHNNELLFKYSNDVAYEFYCEDFFNDSEFKEPVSFKDICYSRCLNNPSNYAERLASRFVSSVKRKEFDIDNDSDIMNLVCYICNKINTKEYEKYKTINDIDKEIPIEVFINIYNNQKEAIPVVINRSETRMAGLLKNIKINSSMMGIFFVAKMEFIARNIKGHFVRYNQNFMIHPKSFSIKTLEDLGIEILKEEEMKTLISRGNKYIKLTEKPYYCKYNGPAFKDSWKGDEKINVNSRFMIDLKLMTHINPDIDSDWYYGNINFNEDGALYVDHNELWMLSPVIYGFSFGSKEWCRILVDNVEDIIFSETAINDLIIPKEHKDLFLACVSNNMPSLDDIENKGAGKIFLLYGPPGVGKTLSAEAVSEYLHKPLYFVSVGELGTDPDQLEHSLENIMTIASSWDAIILLDEVDVFAINREGSSIERNAMTAIFLRTLERYSGIMFMTTNLLNNLDPAFISRATAVIGYKDLSIEDRISIWMKMISKAKDLKEISIAEDVYTCIPLLAKEYNINGRLIKNTVRLAYTLALSRDKILKANDLICALSLRSNIK